MTAYLDLYDLVGLSQLSAHSEEENAFDLDTVLGGSQENSGLAGGPGIKSHWNLTERIGSTANAYDASLTDVNQDGELEVIVSKSAQCEFFCLEQDGDILWQTPLLSTHRPGYYGTEVTDIDGDDDMEFVAVADSIWVFDAASGEEVWRVEGVGDLPNEVPWALGHITSKTRWNVIVARTEGDSFLVSVFDWRGDLIWSLPIADATYGHTISVADVDEDGYDEIFVPCSKRTVAIDDDGQVMWAAPLTGVQTALTSELAQSQDLLSSAQELSQVQRWWYHSDFVEITELYEDGQYYVIHDYGGGVLDPTVIQVLDALTGQVVDSFQSYGHHQWLKAADLRPDFEGQEIVYVTREKVIMLSSNLAPIWERALSGAHELGLGDWNGDGREDIIVTTIFRGLKRFAGVDSNFVVYDAYGVPIFNMLYHYPQGGKYAGAQMQTAMREIQDLDNDGRVDVPVSFSNHDVGKFSSSKDVHQYIMSFDERGYVNLFHEEGNYATARLTDTMLSGNQLQLRYLSPVTESNPGTEDGVRMLFHMNEGTGDLVKDASAYQNDGLLEAGAWTAGGRFGKAISFSAPAAVIRVPYTTSLDLSRVFVDAWISPVNQPVNRTVIEKPESFWLRMTHNHYLQFCFRDSQARRGKEICLQAPFSNFDRFSYIAMSYDGVTLRLMVDGEEVASETHVGAIDIIDSDLYVGNNEVGTESFQGVIDELRVSHWVQPLPVQRSGVWDSKLIPFEPRTLEFSHQLNGGYIAYTILDKHHNPLANHDDITTSSHHLGDISGPIRVRVTLTRDAESRNSPYVHAIQVSERFDLYFPTVKAQSR